jgi:hypothetical protein
MKRKDGRELVTEHPLTGMDMIDVIPPGELPSIPAGEGLRGYVRKADREPWAGDDLAPEAGDFDGWGA